MKQYFLTLTILFSPMAFAQGFQDFLTGEDTAAKEEPAPKPEKKPVDTPTQAIVEQPAVPAVDKLADVRCSAGKFTSLGGNSGPNKNDAEDIIISVLGITSPLDRVIVQTGGIKAGEKASTFGVTNRKGFLQIGLPGKGFLNGTVWLPAKMCVTDDNKISAFLDASSVGYSNAIPLTIENLGNGSIRVSGSLDGKTQMNAPFAITNEALR